jgi:hypothetical protein
LRIQRVRIDESGFTRRTSTVPLLALPLFEVLNPSGLGPVLPRGLLSWAFRVLLDGGPPIITLALQSFKEPEDWKISFETHRPP